MSFITSYSRDFSCVCQLLAPHFPTWGSEKVSTAGCSDSSQIYSFSFFSLKKKKSLQQTNIQDEGNRRGSYGLLRTLTSLFVANFHFFFFLAAAGSLQDLSSLTRDQTWAPCSGSAES